MELSDLGDNLYQFSLLLLCGLMDLKELVKNTNQLVQQEGHTLQDLIQKNNFPSNAESIIQLIRENEAQLIKPSEDDYAGLLNALKKRREISLKATYAATMHLLKPDMFPLKSLDNFNTNLQSEKNILKDPAMAESEELSQADIEALLAGNLSDKNDKKPKVVDDQLSNDDIEALLAAESKPKADSKKAATPEVDLDALIDEVSPSSKKAAISPSKKEEQFSNEDIEALLAGEAPKDSAKKESSDAESELNSFLESNNVQEDSAQISEDDIQALLEAQSSQDKKNPLVQALNDEIANNTKGNTNKIKKPEPIIESPKFEAEAEESVSDKTKMPQDIFPSQKNLEELITENQKSPQPADEFDFKSLGEEFNKIKSIPTTTPAPSTFIKDAIKPTVNSSQTNTEDLLNCTDVKERVLSDVYALYVNKGGKPVLHAECQSREDAKKAYLQAMQNYPQNSLFIEKISRKEIIVIKESKEIINLKIDITFE